MALPQAVKYDWQPFIQGADWARYAIFSTSGIAEDLTGYTAKMTIRDKPNTGGAIILDLTTVATANGSVLTITGATGRVDITLTDLDTDNFKLDTYYYELRLVSPAPDSIETPVLYGKMTVIRNVTL